MADRLPRSAGNAFGRALAYLDGTTLATWSGSSGLKLLLSRWYARVFGFPELAAHRRFRSIQGMLGRHAGDRVLDLGAGNGLYSVAHAVGRPDSVHLLADISIRHMRRAAATGSALALPIRAIVCSAEAIPLATGSVDTVLIIEVLQFIDDDAAALQEVARVLRPGGVLLCEQDRPAIGTVLVWTPELRLRKRRVGYTAKALCELASRAGLVLEGSRIVSGRVGRWWESVDGRIFRKSRALHLVLFPLARLLAWLLTPAPVEGEAGTALYVFRKHGAAAGTGREGGA